MRNVGGRWHWFVVMLLLASVWGSSFLLIKKSLLSFTPYQVASLRISIAGLCMVPFFIREVRRVQQKDWLWIIIVGLAGTAIPSFCYPIAETQISGITTGILNSLTPVFTLLMGLLFFGRQSNWLQLLGILLGLTGAIVIISANKSASDNNLWYGLFVVAGTILYALSSNILSSRLGHLGSITIGVVAFSLLLIPALVFLMTTDILEVVRTHPMIKVSLPAVIFLALFGTAAASVLYFRLVQMTSAVQASLVAYLIPVVAIFLGLWDGEAFTWIQSVGLLLIASGIYLSRKRKGI